MLKSLRLAALAALLAWAPAWSAGVALNPDHPDRYVVVEGDTLWDIAARFLRDPWLWPNIWYANPQIANPHLIYPGDVISLVYVDGQPRLRLSRGLPVVKLSPKVRVEPIRRAIPTIPLDAVEPFLTRPLVTTREALDQAPYVVQAADEHVITGAGDRVYARGLPPDGPGTWVVVRAGDEYVDPDTGEFLGLEATYVGDAEVQRMGDPATLWLTGTSREVLVGDRLMPVAGDGEAAVFQPQPAPAEIEGRIIAVVDGVSQIGQHQVVVINRGSREGLERGHVLAVYQAGEVIPDTVSEDPDDTVRLPDERAGELMVFRVFDKVSYGLIMRAARAMHVLDTVRAP